MSSVFVPTGDRWTGPVLADDSCAASALHPFADLPTCRWVGQNFSGINANNARLDNASFINSKMVGISLRYVHTSEATFSGDDLTRADFSRADLMSAKFSYGNYYTNADFSGVFMPYAKFSPIEKGHNIPITNFDTTCPGGNRGPCTFRME
jgi:uncharacterized protein YjbI with pentapeptide repeats